LVSVNVALNSHEYDPSSDEDRFEGGGTFFEGLIRNPKDMKLILRPIGAGHAVAHLSTERHAGDR